MQDSQGPSNLDTNMTKHWRDKVVNPDNTQENKACPTGSAQAHLSPGHK